MQPEELNIVRNKQHSNQSAGGLNHSYKYGLCDDYSYCIDASYAKGITFEYFLKTHRRQLVIEKYMEKQDE